MSAEWVRTWFSSEQVVFRVGRDGEYHVAEWVGFAELRARRDGSDATFTPCAGADQRLVEKYQRGPVRALLRHLEGRLTLHASSFAWHDRAVVCVGDSGDGKSTTVHAACARAGAFLMADDTTPIEFEEGRVVAVPGDVATWLLPDALEQFGLRSAQPQARKTAIYSTVIAPEPTPMAAIVRLSFADGDSRVSLRRVTGHKAFLAMTQSQIRFVLDEPNIEAYDFARIAALVAAIPVFELTRPRRLNVLDECVDAILRVVESCTGVAA